MQLESKKLNKIIVICDYRNQFYFSSKKKGASLNLNYLKSELSKYFSSVEITTYVKIVNFDLYHDVYILYHTSEDPGLKYKDYIEDVLLALKSSGAILLPEFELFRAHHNKVFAELYTKSKNIIEWGAIPTLTYGTFDEYYDDFILNKFKGKILVFKRPDSTKSAGVIKLDSSLKKILIPFFYSLTFDFNNLKRYTINLLYQSGYTRQSNNRKKFVIQDFLYSPDGDYRVIVYWDHFYVLHRKNRENDFRASGSGIFNFDKELPSGLLDYSSELFNKFDCPYMAMDIGISDGKFVLYEYQAISMGQFAAENAPHYFQKKTKTNGSA